ncbi:DUF3953 domain-containing protein [Metabacillus sp. 84]|uniref:DUF3953 domain-containing protein n=1 Tax=Metabacillus sp. 84 TaxID=3404705 RepID=UPI003CEDD48A
MFQVLLSLLILVLSVYIFLSDDFALLDLSMLLMGLLLIVMGLREYKSKRIPMAVVLFAVSLFVFGVLVQASYF